MNKKYDVAIIGSGMGGSTLAAILARQGLGRQRFSQPDRLVQSCFVICTLEFSAHFRSLSLLVGLSDKLLGNDLAACFPRLNLRSQHEDLMKLGDEFRNGTIPI